MLKLLFVSDVLARDVSRIVHQSRLHVRVIIYSSGPSFKDMIVRAISWQLFVKLNFKMRACVHACVRVSVDFLLMLTGLLFFMCCRPGSCKIPGVDQVTGCGSAHVQPCKLLSSVLVAHKSVTRQAIIIVDIIAGF